MPVNRLLLRGGLILSVLACALTLVGGALALLLHGGGARDDLRLALSVWVAGFAGTFALSVMFLSSCAGRADSAVKNRKG